MNNIIQKSSINQAKSQRSKYGAFKYFLFKLLQKMRRVSFSQLKIAHFLGLKSRHTVMEYFKELREDPNFVVSFRRKQPKSYKDCTLWVKLSKSGKWLLEPNLTQVYLKDIYIKNNMPLSGMNLWDKNQKEETETKKKEKFTKHLNFHGIDLPFSEFKPWHWKAFHRNRGADYDSRLQQNLKAFKPKENFASLPRVFARC